jgi:predicted DNA repair protein MutK
MAGSSLLILIDDIATVLDDVALMTKAATKKTAGVLGDDLALNAEQVTGVKPARELPVVWAVAKGSMINKAILVPAALAISFFIPWLVTPLLMLGGGFLCFEGFEKLVHKFLHREEDKQHKNKLREALKDPEADLRTVEKDKIKGAIRTDFILSAEIIAITLGIVATQAITVQALVLTVVAVMVTVVVYGLVAGIVKLDYAGLYLSQQASASARKLGEGIVWVAPYLMRGLSILGTIAMFLVGGGILAHGVPPVYEAINQLAWNMGGIAGALEPTVANGLIGLLAGAILVAILTPLTKLWQARKASA